MLWAAQRANDLSLSGLTLCRARVGHERGRLPATDGPRLAANLDMLDRIPLREFGDSGSRRVLRCLQFPIVLRIG